MMASVLKRGGLIALVFLTLLEFHSVHAQGTIPTSLCDEFILPNGYPCEEITRAGRDPRRILLGLYNIPFGRNRANRALGPPVLLVPGVLSGGDNFLLRGPNGSLGFFLADAGYDVYVGNNRNAQWSRGSSRYTQQDKGYWDWTFDELAAFDLSSLVNSVYNRRGSKKLFYIGHSQGNLILTTGLTGGGPSAMAVKDKLRGAVFLAPVAYITFLTAPLFNLLLTLDLQAVGGLLNGNYIDTTTLTNIVCKADTTVCSLLGTPLAFGTNSFIFDQQFANLFKYYPQNISVSNVNHFAQVKQTAQLRKFDRGIVENLQRYGQATPPFYNLSQFPSASFPQLFFTGGIDQLADPIDVARLFRELPDAGNRRIVNLTNYGHEDLVLSNRGNLDFFPEIVSFFRNN